MPEMQSHPSPGLLHHPAVLARAWDDAAQGMGSCAWDFRGGPSGTAANPLSSWGRGGKALCWRAAVLRNTTLPVSGGTKGQPGCRDTRSRDRMEGVKAWRWRRTLGEILCFQCFIAILSKSWQSFCNRTCEVNLHELPS